MILSFDLFNWNITANLDDGGRICFLKYNGINLLTEASEKFREPVNFLGEYEKRPVYGYDDCFPSVVSCKLPDLDFEVADHGSVCWRKWNICSYRDSLIFSTVIEELNLKFNRILKFYDNSLIWKYKIENYGDSDIPYIYAPHPLMYTMNVKNLYLPEFDSLYDVQKKYLKPLPSSSYKLADLLVNCDFNSVFMLYLMGVKKKEVIVEFKSGIKLKIIFEDDIFSTLSIWWNRFAYPDEEGIRRDEFAIEPLAGYNSSLIESIEKKDYRIVKAGDFNEWLIRWEIM